MLNPLSAKTSKKTKDKHEPPPHKPSADLFKRCKSDVFSLVGIRLMGDGAGGEGADVV